MPSYLRTHPLTSERSRYWQPVQNRLTNRSRSLAFFDACKIRAFVAEQMVEGLEQIRKAAFRTGWLSIMAWHGGCGNQPQKQNRN